MMLQNDTFELKRNTFVTQVKDTPCSKIACFKTCGKIFRSYPKHIKHFMF